MVTDLIQTVVLAPLAQVPPLRVLHRAWSRCSTPSSRCCCCCAWPPALLLARALHAAPAPRLPQARASNSALTSQIQETLAGIRVIKAYGAEAREQLRFEAALAGRLRRGLSRAQLLRALGVLAFVLVARRDPGRHRASRRCARSRAPRSSRSACSPRPASPPGTSASSTSRRPPSARARRRSSGCWCSGRARRTSPSASTASSSCSTSSPRCARRRTRSPLAPPRRGIAFPRRRLRLSARPPGARRGLLRGALRRGDGAARPHRRGQEHAAGAAPAAVRSGRGRASRSTASTCAGSSSRACARASRSPCRRTCSSARPFARTSATRGPDASDAEVARRRARRLRRRLHRGAAARLRHAARRTRRAALDRTAPAHLDRARACSRTRRSWCSTSRPPRSTPRPSRSCCRTCSAWGRGRAILLVTHRLSTLRHADRIVLLEQGRVIEAGSRAELMARPGAAPYRSLLRARGRRGRRSGGARVSSLPAERRPAGRTRDARGSSPVRCASWRRCAGASPASSALTLVSLAPRLLLPWPVKLIIDHVINRDSGGGALASYPALVRPPARPAGGHDPARDPALAARRAGAAGGRDRRARLDGRRGRPHRRHALRPGATPRPSPRTKRTTAIASPAACWASSSSDSRCVSRRRSTTSIARGSSSGSSPCRCAPSTTSGSATPSTA